MKKKLSICVLEQKKYNISNIYKDIDQIIFNSTQVFELLIRKVGQDDYQTNYVRPPLPLSPPASALSSCRTAVGQLLDLLLITRLTFRPVAAADFEWQLAEREPAENQVLS